MVRDYFFRLASCLALNQLTREWFRGKDNSQACSQQRIRSKQSKAQEDLHRTPRGKSVEHVRRAGKDETRARNKYSILEQAESADTDPQRIHLWTSASI